MTPDQIALAIRIGTVAAVLAAAAAGGWMLNGWRLSGAFERLEGERKHLADQVAVLAVGVKACSASVDLAKKAGDAAIASGRAMLAEARRVHAGGTAQAARIEALLEKPTPAGAGCDAAWQEIEKARAAR